MKIEIEDDIDLKALISACEYAARCANANGSIVRSDPAHSQQWFQMERDFYDLRDRLRDQVTG